MSDEFGTMIRMVIRAKLREGISKRTISDLIASFTPEDVVAARTGERAMRLPVELVDKDRRMALLQALANIAVDQNAALVDDGAVPHPSSAGG